MHSMKIVISNCVYSLSTTGNFCNKELALKKNGCAVSKERTDKNNSLKGFPWHVLRPYSEYQSFPSFYTLLSPVVMSNFLAESKVSVYQVSRSLRAPKQGSQDNTGNDAAGTTFPTLFFFGREEMQR